MRDSAQSLHRSWLAALTLSSRIATDRAASTLKHSSSFQGNEKNDNNRDRPAGKRPGAGLLNDFGQGEQRLFGADQEEEERVGEREGAGHSSVPCIPSTIAVTGVVESWLRARLSMPVWPFSSSNSSYGDNGGQAVRDPGGYWSLAGVDGYELWRISAVECAWQGGV